MGQNNAFELIVCIVNRGFCDLVMETARGAGARGGTVLHARGGGQVGQDIKVFRDLSGGADEAEMDAMAKEALEFIREKNRRAFT